MVEVIKRGLYDTIQDLGRIGYQDYGVPFSGVMDRYSATLANSILGNDPNAALIESVMYGPQLKFHVNTTICITGGAMNPLVNGKSVKNNTAISIRKGDDLTFGKLDYGFRVYISVLGGFLTELALNSRSQYQGVTSKSIIKKGDCLAITKTSQRNNNSFSSVKINMGHFQTTELEVFKGPEFEQLSSKIQDRLLNSNFTISKDSNRMAYQIDERFENSLDEIITSLVLPGTLQLTPSGKLMILMRDCQITGGYPRVLQLSEASVDQLSQKIFGLKIRFKCQN